MPEFSYLPTVAAYVKAFRAIEPRLSAKQRRMLGYHLRQSRPVTATELAELVGYQDWRGVNSQYGRVGRYLREQSSVFNNLPGQASHAFAWFDKIPRKDRKYSEWIWSLHDPAREALESLGWFPSV
jgi:hypothetical protein